MLGLAPDRRGLLPDADVKRLEEFGAAIRERYTNNLMVSEHAHSAQDTTGAALDGNTDTFWSAPAGSHSARLEVSFPKPVSFDETLLMEWLNDGQHVEHFKIQAWTGNGWRTLVEGHPIGHKRIDHFSPVTTTRVQLEILSSTAPAHIREFQIFSNQPVDAR